MEVFDCSPETGEVKRFREGCRNRVLHSLHVEERSSDALSEPLLLNAFSERVDRRKGFGKRNAARNRLPDFGMNHLESAAEGGPRLTIDAHD